MSVKFGKDNSGSPEHVAIQIFAVLLIALPIIFALLIKDLVKPKDLIIDADKFSIVSYTVALCLYLFYLANYYKEIWKRYYALENDAYFFNFYAITVILVTAIGLLADPKYWGVYISAILLILFFKKMNTKRLYWRYADSVFMDEYGITADQAVNSYKNNESIKKNGEIIELQGEHKKLLCRSMLASSFTNNFFIWGIIVFGGTSLSVSYNADSLISKVISDGWFTAYHAANLIILLLVVIFFVLKIIGGIERLLRQIEVGECRGLTTILKAPWK